MSNFIDDFGDLPTPVREANMDPSGAVGRTLTFESIHDKAERDKAKKAVSLVLVTLIVLSALTACLPDLTGVNPTTEEVLQAVNSGDNAWVLTCSALVLLMTPGVAFFYGGMVDHKNVISTMFQSFVAMGLISILWTIVGFSLAFGKDANGSGIIGYPKTYFMYNNVGSAPGPLAPTIPLTTFSMFQLMFAMITPTLISGALAERVNFNAWMVFMVIWHLVVYCPLAHLMWHPDGAFFKWGAIDFAGGTVIEMASGYAALAGAIFLGPRTFKPEVHTPANIPSILLGTAIFWFGWLGFNSGSALSSGGLAAQAFVGTNIAGASGMMTWIFLDILTGKPANAVGMCNGIVVGLVAITPACGFVTTGGAMCIGVIANLVCFFVGILFKERTSIDDSLDVFTVHGLGGTVGFLCTAIFASKEVNPNGRDGLIYGEGITLAKHLAIVVVLIPFILIVSYAIFYITNLIIPLRVSVDEEELGLDRSLHNESTHTGSYHGASTHDLNASNGGGSLLSSMPGNVSYRSVNEDNVNQLKKFMALDLSSHSNGGLGGVTMQDTLAYQQQQYGDENGSADMLTASYTDDHASVVVGERNL